MGGGACCSEAGRAPRVGRRRGDGGRRRPGALASALGGGVGVGGGTGRRRRGGRSSERVAELGAARSEGEKEEEPARPSIYRESLRYRVKSKTGT